MTRSVKILGIDPGFGRCGWGLVVLEGNRLRHVAHGVWQSGTHNTFGERLLLLHGEAARAMRRLAPDEAAIEKLYFARNAKTAMDVGQARGVLVLACAQAAVPVAEYQPGEVKQAVTGYGSADKRQVQRMVRALLALEALPRPDDAADALALAICHAQCRAWRRLESGGRR